MTSYTLKLLQVMQSVGITPNVINYNMTTSACVKSQATRQKLEALTRHAQREPPAESTQLQRGNQRLREGPSDMSQLATLTGHARQGPHAERYQLPRGHQRLREGPGATSPSKLLHAMQNKGL